MISFLLVSAMVSVASSRLTDDLDGSAIIEYFQPLIGWLKTQNKGQQCGW